MCVRTAMRLGRSSARAASIAFVDRVEVVAVDDALGLPAVGGEARGHVLGPGHLRRSVELDEVVVVEDDELAEAQVPRQARGLGGDALLEVAVVTR